MKTRWERIKSYFAHVPWVFLTTFVVLMLLANHVARNSSDRRVMMFVIISFSMVALWGHTPESR